MKATKSSSTRAASCCCCWRLQCRVVILSILALAVAANGARVEALRTVLDPNGLPLLLPARSPSGGPLDDDSCRETTTTRAWGGLRRVDLIYLVRKWLFGLPGTRYLPGTRVLSFTAVCVGTNYAMMTRPGEQPKKAEERPR